MKSEREIKSFLLRSLLAAGGEPLTEEVLCQAIRNAFRHLKLPEGDLAALIKDCETEGWISGTNDSLTGLSWLLTTKGKLRAQQL